MRLGRPGLSPRMVGRAVELARLRALVDQAAHQPQVALVAGEGGVGKTRLVQELLDGLDPGTVTLVGRATPGAPGRPFQVLLDALAPHVSAWKGVPPSLEHRKEALSLLLAEMAPEWCCDTDRVFGQEELLRTAVDVVREVARPGTGVLVLEDLHWADSESVAAFARMAIADELPLLVVGTFRPDELATRPAVAAGLLEVERLRPGSHVALHRLDRQEVAEFLESVYGRPIPPHVADAVHARTDGNAFFLEELLAAAGLVAPEDLALRPLPWSLTEVVNRTLVDLDGSQRRVIDAAAVLGQRIPFDLLAAVLGYSEDDLIDALRALVDRGLLVEDEPDVFSFRHALTYQVVLDGLLGRERRRLHEKALLAMQEAGSTDWPALAHHAQGAGRSDEMVDAARAGAAQYQRTGSTAEAFDLAELALTVAPDDVELREVASRAAWFTGRLPEAKEHGEAWRRLAVEHHDVPGEVRALRHLTRLAWERGDEDEQWKLARTAVERAEGSGDAGERAHAYDLMAQVHMLSGEFEPAIEWADRALALAEDTGARLLRPSALVNKATALTRVEGRADEGGELLQEAVAAARAVGDDFSLIRGLNNLLMHLGTRTPLAQLQPLLDEMRAVAERSGRIGQTIGLWANQAAELAERDGDLERRRAALKEVRRLSPPGGVSRAWALGADAAAAAEVGDLDELERIRTIVSAEVPPLRVPMVLAEADAWAAVRAGDAAAAAAAVDAAIDAVADAKRETCDEAGRALLVALRAGVTTEEARRLWDRARRELSAPDDTAIEHQVEGALLALEGDHRGAIERFDRAAPADRVRSAPLLADVDVRRARSLLALGDAEPARSAAERSRARLARWAGWRVDEVGRLLEQLGAAPHPEVAGVLTPREREVAVLVAQGLSNSEIASRLYISTKTASVHVSNILMKLSMSSRAEIAAWAVRIGLATDDAA